MTDTERLAWLETNATRTKSILITGGLMGMWSVAITTSKGRAVVEGCGSTLRDAIDVIAEAQGERGR